jgi:phosphoribosylformylglycinamidine synthase subunit PurL
VALAEMAIAGGVGVEADLDGLVELRGCSGETALFGEGPGGIVLAVAAEGADALLAAAKDAGVDALALGTAGGQRLEISAAEREVSADLGDAERAWRSLSDQVEGFADGQTAPR